MCKLNHAHAKVGIGHVQIPSFCLTFVAGARNVFHHPADYAQAEKFMTYNTKPLVVRNSVKPAWLPDGRFCTAIRWLAGEVCTGGSGARHAAGVQSCAARDYSFEGCRRGLPNPRAAFQKLEFSKDGQFILFDAVSKKWKCDVGGAKCVAQGAATGARNDVESPDKKHMAFLRNDNLWIREAGTKEKETQLTTDGVKDFGYATDNAGWTSSDRAILTWSPDSKKIATFQQDQRGVGEMYLVKTEVGHPELKAWKYPLPGDDKVTMIRAGGDRRGCREGGADSVAAGSASVEPLR